LSTEEVNTLANLIDKKSMVDLKVYLDSLYLSEKIVDFFMHSARFAEIPSRYPPARLPPPEHTCIHFKNAPAAFVFHPVFAPRTAPPFSARFSSKMGRTVPAARPVQCSDFSFINQSSLRRFTLMIDIAFQKEL
jgi:hypothetical protein